MMEPYKSEKRLHVSARQQGGSAVELEAPTNIVEAESVSTPMPSRIVPGPTLGALDAAEVRSKVLGLVEQAVIVRDLAGLIIYMNPFAERLYGWESAMAVGRNFMEINLPDLPREQADEIMTSLRAGKSWSGNLAAQRCDGTPFLAAVTKTPFHDEQGMLCAIVGVSLDITERAAREEELRRSEARFRALANKAPVGVFEADAKGRYGYFNAVAGELLEARPGEFWLDSVHQDDRARVRREWALALSVGGVLESEYRLHSPRGRVILVQGHVTAARGPDGEVCGHVGAIVDVTEKQFVRLQLALASRSAFLGALDQSAMKGIGRAPGSDPVQGVAFDLARVARERLVAGGPFDRVATLQFVDEMIQALQAAPASEPVRARVAKQLADLAVSVPGRIGVRLYDVVNQGIHWLPAAVTEAASITIENLSEQEVSASAGQLEQVIVNLVTNAARATPPGKRGEVTVQIGSGGPGMARVEVIDRGVGIRPSAVGSIFLPFARRKGDKEMGLGLAISHSIVAAHAGTLAVVKSVPGRGSTFRMELPSLTEA
jgi:PAS domain S-box-containing protein